MNKSLLKSFKAHFRSLIFLILCSSVSFAQSPTISSTLSLSSDNIYVNIVFSEGVWDTSGGAGELEVSDLALSLSGGTATLSSTIPITITKLGNYDFSDAWGSNEPNNSGTENIAHIRGSDFGINDEKYNKNYYAILERDFTSTTTPTGYSLFTTYAGHSYYKASSSKTWSTQKSDATAAGGYMLIFNSIAEYNYLTQNFASFLYNSHIGLEQNLSAADYSEPGGGWYWTDGTPLDNSGGDPNTYRIQIGLKGIADGNEILTIIPIVNSIYDADGNLASTSQSNNTQRLFDLTPPIINSTTIPSNNSSITVTFSEPIYNATGGSGAIEASDFALSLSDGTASLSSATPSSISVSGTVYTLGLPLSGTINGLELVSVVPSSSTAIYDASSNVASTTQSNNTVTLNPGGPRINSTALSEDNSSIIVAFSEPVFNSNGGSGSLETSDFVLSLGGGNATLSSTTPTSISVSGNVYTLGLPLSGTPNGFEIVTVWPSSSTSIYDASGNSALPPDYLTSGLILNLDSKNSSSFSWTSTGTTLATTWNDLSGNNNHFTTVGSPTYDVNNGIVFTTGDNYFKIASFSHPTTTYTDEFLLKTTGTGDGIKSYGTLDPDDDNDHLIYDPGDLQIFHASSRYYVDFDTGGDLSFNDGNWYHLVITSNRTTGKDIVYLNGTAVASGTIAAGNLTEQGGTIVLGNDQDIVSGALAVNDPNQAFTGYIPIARMYNKVLTSSEVTQNYNYASQYLQNMNRVKFGLIITGTTIAANNSSIAVTFSEPIYNSNGGSGAIEVSDFNLTLSGGNATLSSATPSSISVIGNTYTLSFSLNGTANGDEVITVNPVLNSIYDSSGSPAIVLQSNNTVNLNDFFAPVINSTTITSNNSDISVTFSESIYNATGGSGLLEVSDFTFSLSGGNATLSSATPSSISINGNVYTLGLSLSGTPNGSETITVVPSSSSAIYDDADNAASTSQSNNTVNLNSPNSTPTDILLSPNSVYENVSLGTIVGSFSTIDSDSGNSHSYSFISGSGSDDNTSFTISGANLLTNTSIDYELKTTYLIRVQTDDQSSCYINSCTFTKTFTIQILDIIEDIDGDGVNDDIDNCLNTANTDQLDTDLDGTGDACDDDDDNDGFLDDNDDFPLDSSEWLDTDGDGQGNNADTDDDGDGYLDEDEIICLSDPIDQENLPLDYDGDFIPDCIDEDDDNDGYLDENDDFPLDSSEWIDTDTDGTGNNADLDDDNDGVDDSIEVQCGTDPLDSSSIPIDSDNDGVFNCFDLDDDNDGIFDTLENLMDFDGDGYPNNLDLDSDDDGCQDTVEAGFEDSDNDGIVGSNPIIVDSQGLVQGVYAYETPLDENQNGDYDFLEFGSDFAPITNLPDQAIYKINVPVKFKINLSSNTNVSYHWQISTDGGISFNNLNNSSRYSGVNSDELILNNPNYSDHNSLFRVELTTLAYACGDKITSNSTLLFYNELFIPNAFSPNGDGINDCWEILGLQNYPGNKLEVYNRLGIKLYETNNYQGDWCGTFNGNQIPDGVYFYQVSLNSVLNEKGYIFVKRN